MKKILIIGLVALAYFMYPQSGTKNAEPLSEPKAAISLSRESGKILVISVGSENCGRCKAMKKSVANGEVELGKDYFVWLDIDYYSEEMKWFKRSYGLDVKSFPAFVAISKKGKILNYSPGIISLPDLNIFLNKARLADEES